MVDDHRDAARVLNVLLSALGHEVRTAESGEQALACAAEFRPEVVLLDIGLPKVDGYEVARRLRARPEGRDMKLVAMTGWGADEDRRRAAEAGFDLHLVKPVDAQALESALAGKTA